MNIVILRVLHFVGVPPPSFRLAHIPNTRPCDNINNKTAGLQLMLRTLLILFPVNHPVAEIINIPIREMKNPRSHLSSVAAELLHAHIP